APDAEALLVLQGVVQAFSADGAGPADLLGRGRRAALFGEEGLGVRFGAERVILPRQVFRRGGGLGYGDAASAEHGEQVDEARVVPHDRTADADVAAAASGAHDRPPSRSSLPSGRPPRYLKQPMPVRRAVTTRITPIHPCPGSNVIRAMAPTATKAQA